MKTLLFLFLTFILSINSFGQTSVELNYSGVEKDELKDYKGAIAEYSKAIALNPKYAIAYYNRGISKNNLKDYLGAIADYTKAIEINPKDAAPYLYRGISKISMNQKANGCLDLRKAADLGSEEASELIKESCN
ncbi:MAG: hypothetical protein A3F72_01475 [Bacteroidetes bacterium RIFCSPLOWO2_12_FULL_35_15]|nr:MAG: hypothetical protein A3F72_01475 [Bacteroidetes bacterium RIFCSPLOWO2_12_FULL_35_15]